MHDFVSFLVSAPSDHKLQHKIKLCNCSSLAQRQGLLWPCCDHVNCCCRLLPLTVPQQSAGPFPLFRHPIQFVLLCQGTSCGGNRLALAPNPPPLIKCHPSFKPSTSPCRCSAPPPCSAKSFHSCGMCFGFSAGQSSYC